MKMHTIVIIINKGGVMNKSTTTIRIYKECHKELSLFLQENGLKSVRAVSTALVRAVKEKPELFIPDSMNKHNTEHCMSEASSSNESDV